LYRAWAQNDVAGRVSDAFLAWKGSRAIGFLAADLDAVAPQHGGSIDLIVVDPAARGLGVGRTLMSYISELCRLKNVPRLNLGVHETNTAARSLYRGLGFSQDYVLLERATWIKPR
jgi:ribosomal protein S18 acetylase RimI-like enzyme